MTKLIASQTVGLDIQAPEQQNNKSQLAHLESESVCTAHAWPLKYGIFIILKISENINNLRLRQRAGDNGTDGRVGQVNK